MTQSAPGHPHDHWHRRTPAISDFRGVVHELIEAGGDEVVELQLADRPLARQRRADADAEDAAFRERGIDDAIAELGKQRAQQEKGVAVRAADVLAIDEHTGVSPQRVANPESDRLEERAAAAIHGRAGLQRG